MIIFSSLVQIFTFGDIPLKALFIFIEILKLNEFKFKYINDRQLANIFFILLTFEVSKFDKSKYFNCLQSSNIYPIFLTLEVSKFDKSIDIKL